MGTNRQAPRSPEQNNGERISQLYELSEELEVFWNVTRSIAETAKRLEEPFRQEQVRYKTIELELANAQRMIEEAKGKIVQLESAIRAEHQLKQDLLARIESESQGRKQSHTLFEQEKKRTTNLQLQLEHLQKDLKAHQTLARDKNQELSQLKALLPKREQHQKRLEQQIASLEKKISEQDEHLKQRTEMDKNYKTVLEQLQNFKNLATRSEGGRLQLAAQIVKIKEENETLRNHFETAKKNVERLFTDRQMLIKQLNGLRAHLETMTQQNAAGKLQQTASPAAPTPTPAKPPAPPRRSSTLFQRKRSPSAT